MKIRFLVLLLLGILSLGAEGATGRRRAACPSARVVVLQPASESQQKAAGASNALATELRKSAAAFEKAANARDAKAAAALWTAGGEFTDEAGNSIRGRDNLGKMYAKNFAAAPKGNFQLTIESVRQLGENLAASEGILKFAPADGTETTSTTISAMHVREGNGWLVASAKESPSDSGMARVADLAFLIGDWEAMRDDRSIRISYAWNDGKTFIQSRFTVTEKGEVTASGIEVLGRDPGSGVLRSWLFDKSGAIGESTWKKDGDRWLIEASGTLAQGLAMSATNILIPLGKDAFSWQSVDRSVGEQAMPDHPPLKVTRIQP